MSGVRLIAGSGRSGTTWIQDALASANGLRPVFEPLHPWLSEIGARYAHRPLAPDDEHPDLEQYLHDVFAGKRNRLWTKYRRQRKWLLPPLRDLHSRRAASKLYRNWGKFAREAPGLAIAGMRADPLVKCIRMNLMLGWMSRRFGSRTVLVVRHPGAVLESELRGEWGGDHVLNQHRSDPQFHEYTSNRYRGLLARTLNRTEALAARWVIENQCAMEQARANSIAIVFYEHLRSAPDREWPRVCRALGLVSIPAAALLVRPSQQSSKRTSVESLEAHRQPRWIASLTSEQRASIQSVLDQVAFRTYSMDQVEPCDPDESVRHAVATGAGP